MLMYLISIIGAQIIIFVVNFLLNGKFFDFSLPFLIYASATVSIYVILIDGVFATFIRRALPNKWFSYDVKFHEVGKKEINFYEKIGIKNWKDHVVELGMFTNFSKKKVNEPENREYIERFILECNYGAWIHVADAVFGYLLIFCYPLKYWLCFAFPAATVNAILNMLPFCILRYNLPRLMRLRKVLELKEKREEKNLEK